jgi:NAD(P)-dependent dehydrogenase (short-subunit alcohol dehydrogenase family)
MPGWLGGFGGWLPTGGIVVTQSYRREHGGGVVPQREDQFMQARRFLVTGGSQGIGAAVVELARAAGHQVVFTGRNESLIDSVARKTGAHGLRADVADSDDNARTVAACLERMGGIEVLINNAAYGYRAEIGALDVAAMRKMFDTNVFGMVDIIGQTIMAALNMPRRVLWPELAVFANNPWKED